MATHVWDLAKEQPKNDRWRAYVCARCGVGPIQKDIFDDKGSLLSAARKAGISSDCNVEIARKIHDS